MASTAHSDTPAQNTQKIVIAHRGASGYLPEHSLPAKTLAYGMGADYLEQDCVLTADDQAIVLHDVHLDTVSDVAELFPQRAREDGRYYAIDFTLQEIKTLSLNERIDLKTGKPVFPKRFPDGKTTFRVPTLAEEIELVQGLNHSTGRNVGIYPEIKKPAWHRQQGKDISRVVLRVLNDYGYTKSTDRVFVQCFDAAETRRLRTEFKTQLPLIQLIDTKNAAGIDQDFAQQVTKEGLAEIAEYANGIGPSWRHLILAADSDGRLISTSLVSDAHALGLAVHPYTFRADNLPDFTQDFDGYLRAVYFDIGVNGLFTDFPDRAVGVLKKAKSR